MTIQINRERCAGCGVCMDTCPEGAIQLMDSQAVIDEGLCTQCKACIDACPNGAISEVRMPERSFAIMRPSTSESSPVPIQIQPALAKSKTPARSLAPLAGAALAFLGKEVAPRLVDVVVTALENRLVRTPKTSTLIPSSSSFRNQAAQRTGKHRQTRYRGGQTGHRNPKMRGGRNHRTIRIED
jgi:Fe-S-cluster-containing hydrogenase component 2